MTPGRKAAARHAPWGRAGPRGGPELDRVPGRRVGVARILSRRACAGDPRRRAGRAGRSAGHRRRAGSARGGRWCRVTGNQGVPAVPAGDVHDVQRVLGTHRHGMCRLSAGPLLGADGIDRLLPDVRRGLLVRAAQSAQGLGDSVISRQEPRGAGRIRILRAVSVSSSCRAARRGGDPRCC
ncbi:MAG: hypothetical protein D6738_01085 [Acidobacteria bacterium]|nr:MAG: hypothetical protein D6738_01085 [Acidobacteriota bacterium]